MSDESDERNRLDPVTGVNPPFVIRAGRAASLGELIEHHTHNGSIEQDSVRDHLGLERTGRGGR